MCVFVCVYVCVYIHMYEHVYVHVYCNHTYPPHMMCIHTVEVSDTTLYVSLSVISLSFTVELLLYICIIIIFEACKFLGCHKSNIFTVLFLRITNLLIHTYMTSSSITTSNIVLLLIVCPLNIAYSILRIAYSITIPITGISMEYEMTVRLMLLKLPPGSIAISQSILGHMVRSCETNRGHV